MKIVWSALASSDLEATRDYIARDSPYYAARFVGRIVRAVRVLEKAPEIGQIVREAGMNDVRELICQNYRLIYQVKTNHVRILAVIHGARDLTSLEPKPWDVS